MADARVGVDVGGTNIRAAVADDGGAPGPHVARRTPAAEGPDAVFDAIAATAREAAGERALGLVTVGIPGPLDSRTGVVFAAPHLPGFVNVNAVAALTDRLQCAVEVHNDASLAGFAEWTRGAGRGVEHMVFVTASTGIGGAFIIDGHLVAGIAGTAGELGHVPVAPNGPACGSGHVGCLEGVASGSAIARRAREALARGTETSLAGQDPEALDAVTVERAARDGDELAISLYRDAGRELGRVIGGLINMLSPQLVVVGGGLINAGDLLFDPLHAGVGEIAFAVPAMRCRVSVAELGTDAGLIGAVEWAARGRSSTA